MHDHIHGTPRERMWIVLVLNLAIALAEIIGGIVSGSMALLSDAVHNLGDALSVATSYIAILIARRPATEKYSFGYKRAEVLAAFFNSSLLLFILALVLLEALRRLISPVSISTGAALVVAVVALVANTASALLLHRHSKHSINVRSVYLHMIGDVLSSLVVLSSLLIIRYTGLYVIDPLVSILVTLYIAREAVHLLKEAADILMDSSPIDLRNVKETLESIPGVRNAHHCHAWRLSEHEIALECHVDVDGDLSISSAQRIIVEAKRRLQALGVIHVTLQIENGLCKDKSLVCSTADDRAVATQCRADK